MSSFDLNIISEKERVGSEFMFKIAQELQRAFLAEKKAHKITQQAVAEKLETSRAVINRQLQGLENIGSRRIGELFWALGYEPYFEARKIPETVNDYSNHRPSPSRGTEQITPVPPQKTGQIIGAPDLTMRHLWDASANKPAPVPAS